MKKLFFISLLIVVSCSKVHQWVKKDNTAKNQKFDPPKSWVLVDGSGKYQYLRDVKNLKNQTITRVQLKADNTPAAIEKSLLIAEEGVVQISKNKNEKVFRPSVSQFSVWLEGKKYSVQHKILRKTRQLEVVMESPEPKWSGTKLFTLPHKKYFCFFQQIPECVKKFGIIKPYSKGGQELELVLIWDSYPYLQDQYVEIGQEPMVNATWKLEMEEEDHLFRYSLDIGNQIIFYHFTKSGDFIKMSWVAQGLSVFPSGKNTASENLE